MKNTAALLLFLGFVTSAWAADDASVPAKTSESKPASETMQAAPVAETSVYIELKGSARNVAAVASQMAKEAVYMDASCSTRASKKSAKVVKIICTKANGGLMTYLSRNATAKVQWSIMPAGCAAGCLQMHCPPPSGPLACCKRTSHGYLPC